MYCVNLIRPPDIESCNSHACEVIWITGEWTEVGTPSRCHSLYAMKSLLYFSMRLFMSTSSAEMTEIIPASCLEYRCCFTLVVYPVLQCSASCGQGYHQRLISCSEVHMENENYGYGHQSLSNCPGTPPESHMPCNLAPCPPPHEWRVGIWGPVRDPRLDIYHIFVKMQLV